MSSSAKINNDNLKLAIIAYAKARPCIWDSSVEYSKNERDEAWRSFSEGFSLPVPELRKRWEGLRQVYCQHLKASIALCSVVKWPYFSKLDDFLRASTLRIWQKEGTMPEAGSTSRVMEVEYIDLSSDSDGKPNKNEATPGLIKRVESSEEAIEKPPGNVVKLQMAEDVRNELRKIPPVAGSSEGLQKEPERGSSVGVPQRSESSAVPRRPSLGKKRKSLPDIPDAKRRLIKNCGELIALKKVEPNDNLSRSLPLGNATVTSSPPHKMFGSTSANIAPKSSSSTTSHNGKSLLKKIKQKMEKRERKPFKKKVSAPATAPSTSSGDAVPPVAAGDANKLSLSSEITKLPSCTAITMVSSGSDLPKVTVRLTPSSEGVTLHSVPVTSGQDPRIPTQDVHQKDEPRERRKSKKNREHEKDKLRRKIEARKVADLIVLDNSDSEVTTTKPDHPVTPAMNPDVARQQIALDQGKPDRQKTEKDLLEKWQEECRELCRTEDESIAAEGHEKDDLEAAREVRKNFLLSFLPDMAEMTVEQLRFFKSKLMYLACNIDQFS